MTKKKEKEKLERDAKRERLAEAVKNALDDDNAADFVQYLYDEGYFKSLPESELDGVVEDIEKTPNDWGLIVLGNDIMAAVSKDIFGISVGLDPKDCFDRPSRCSILAYFPMSNREYKRFITCVKKINGEDPEYRKKWMEEAPEDFYGDFEIFGEEK